MLAFAMVSGCGPSGAPAAVTTMVIGIQSEPLTGAVSTLHVVTTTDGATSSDLVLPASELPQEVRLTPAPGNSGAALGVRVESYAQPGWMPRSGGSPALVRTASTHFVPGKVTLLRLMLQGQCLAGLPGGPPGAPSCAEPDTCIGGVCASDVIPVSALEAYAADWPSNAPDVCKPANAPAAVVQVGTGQTDFLPVVEGQTVQVEQGPQGGHHIWIAVRQENLKQTGSTTTLTSVVPAIGLAGPKAAFAFTFHQDQGGFCKLSGLRYQLDVDGTDYRAFLGQTLDVTVTIHDPSGAAGSGTARVAIDPQLLCPAGMPGCP